MAFQTNAFQNNAFQIISRVKARYDYAVKYDNRDKSAQDKRNWMQLLADEAFQKQLDDLQQDELDFLDLLVVMMAEEA